MGDTTIDLEAIRKMRAAITPGPWAIFDDEYDYTITAPGDDGLASVSNGAEAEFIAAAPEIVDSLLATVAQQAEEIAKLKQALTGRTVSCAACEEMAAKLTEAVGPCEKCGGAATDTVTLCDGCFKRAADVFDAYATLTTKLTEAEAARRETEAWLEEKTRTVDDFLDRLADTEEERDLANVRAEKAEAERDEAVTQWRRAERDAGKVAKALRREVEILRQYGNKDCTAMADAALAAAAGEGAS